MGQKINWLIQIDADIKKRIKAKSIMMGIGLSAYVESILLEKLMTEENNKQAD